MHIPVATHGMEAATLHAKLEEPAFTDMEEFWEERDFNRFNRNGRQWRKVARKRQAAYLKQLAQVRASLGAK